MRSADAPSPTVPSNPRHDPSAASPHAASPRPRVSFPATRTWPAALPRSRVPDALLRARTTDRTPTCQCSGHGQKPGPLRRKMESPSSPASFPLFPRKVWDRPPPSESGFGGQVALRWGRALDTCRAAPVSQFRTLPGPGTRCPPAACPSLLSASSPAAQPRKTPACLASAPATPPSPPPDPAARSTLPADTPPLPFPQHAGPAGRPGPRAAAWAEPRPAPGLARAHTPLSGAGPLRHCHAGGRLPLLRAGVHPVFVTATVTTRSVCYRLLRV